ncbi:hypothetical protein [Deinococcus sp. Leaf326]|uniref:hypothetical protein n=1 Tax=Deinococcus sp. Leaf326 TaxID=1736338 RepID=UPI0006F288B0|nr:hypothetical protein [Deinococcus sp. Leaf326]KQR40801.1 hypothetical protein ASF71_01135 [Deinococcus sp. Leaf326]
MKRLSLALTLLAALGTAHAQDDAHPFGLPRTLTWGAYSVQVTPRTSLSGDTDSAVVVRQAGRTLLTVKDWNVDAELQPIRPGGAPELVLSAYSGGAHCCTTMYVFTQDTGRLENLAVFDAGDDPGAWRDLNGDGVKEFVWGSNTLTYYDWSFAESPFLSTVLGWDGVRLADRTRLYAYVPAQEAARELKIITEGLRPGTQVDNLKPVLSGYFANMILAGRGAEAEKVMAAQIFPKRPALKTWFTANRTALINSTYGQPESRLQAVNSKVYPVPQPPEEQP